MCQIIITGVSGILGESDTSHPLRVEVSGTAEDCPKVAVTVNGFGPVEADVEADGTWTAVLHEGVAYPVDGLRCGDAVKVHAECTEGDCPKAEWNGPLPCRGESDPCPAVTLEVVAVEGCKGGLIEVTLKATASGVPPNTVYTWDFGNGEDEAALLTTPEMTRTVSYPPGGPYTSTFGFILPQGCPGATPLTVGPFDPCPPECPTATIEVVEVGDECVDGRRTVTVTATTDGPEAPDSFAWEFSDEAAYTTEANQVTHVMDAAATHQASVAVVVTWPDGCTDLATEGFAVAACAEDDEDETDTDTGDGNETDTGDGNETDTGEQDEVIETPPPQPAPWCGLIRILGLILLIVGLVLVFGGACASNVVVAGIGIGLAVAGAALLILWALCCAPAAGGCRLLQQLIELLSLLEIALTVIAVIFGILSIFEIGLPCLIGTVIDWGIVGFLIAVLTLIFGQIGCQFRRPTLLDGLLGGLRRG
ncbi:MAG: hypothetical protein KatS3mg043_1208 [Rhodothermaceae bacterium]|nr:MAG: hypothetical protein KatS3mg043_1208 [Rhodothermaceae bacterium]